MELWPKLLRRQQEEEIISLVNLDDEWIDQQRTKLLGSTPLSDFLELRQWTEHDLKLHLSRSEALRRFSHQHFGPALEELFLSSKGAHDTVIYSILRVKDFDLAQELWIRLEENEATFSELAVNFGEGPESAHKGILGPTPIGTIYPKQLAQILRTLQPGQVHPPQKFGEWVVLLRLENLRPARFDSQMKDYLLNKQIDDFLQKRVDKLLLGESLPPLQFDSTS